MAFSDGGVAPLHEFAPRVDLSDPVERARLSSDALHAFFNILEIWKIRDIDARRLLGGVSQSAFRALGNEDERVLDEEMIRRIACLVGIFRSLNILFGEKLADEWVQLPNQNAIFGGATPLEHLMNGDLSAFATVRKYLDAGRAGH